MPVDPPARCSAQAPRVVVAVGAASCDGISRRSIDETPQEIDDADAGADLGRVELLTDEREVLLEQLRTATGMSGSGRTTGSSRQRARIAVRKAIVAAVARIAETDPWLGRHLRDHVHTECRYESDPDYPIRWVLS